MTKLTLLSVVTASLLLIGCGEDKSAETKSEPAKIEAHASAQSETVADKAAKAVEATKAAASAAVEKTAEVAKEAQKAVSEHAKKAVDATKEAASAVAEKTAEVAKEAKNAVKNATTSAPASYAKCAGCHGKDGKMKALGKSAIIAGQSKDDLIKKIGEYKAGTRNVSGMGSLMKGQVAGLKDSDIEAIATYLSSLK
jgi:cytochrome c553